VRGIDDPVVDALQQVGKSARTVAGKQELSAKDDELLPDKRVSMPPDEVLHDPGHARAVDRIAKANALVPCDRRAEIEVLFDRVTLRVGLFRKIIRNESRIAGARKVKREHGVLLPGRLAGRLAVRLFENRQPIPRFGARSKRAPDFNVSAGPPNVNAKQYSTETGII